MAVSSQFTALIKDLLAPLEPIVIRRMFSGAGVFRDGQMFALIVGEALYLKADETGRGAFLAEGMGPFTYATTGGTNTINSYWRAPDRLLDEPEELVEWGRRAIATAQRLRKSAKPGRNQIPGGLRPSRGRSKTPRVP
jgi:DNA transformation protein